MLMIVLQNFVMSEGRSEKCYIVTEHTSVTVYCKLSMLTVLPHLSRHVTVVAVLQYKYIVYCFLMTAAHHYIAKISTTKILPTIPPPRTHTYGCRGYFSIN